MAIFLGVVAKICLFCANCFVSFCRAVYFVLKFLRIRFLTLYLSICGLLHLWRPIEGKFLLFFWIGFSFCCACTVIAWVIKLTKAITERKSKAERDQLKLERKENRKFEKGNIVPQRTSEFPIYFQAEGHPGYYFAEYEDRFELFRQKNGKLVHIRTDKKENG